MLDDTLVKRNYPQKKFSATSALLNLSRTSSLSTLRGTMIELIYSSYRQIHPTGCCCRQTAVSLVTSALSSTLRTLNSKCLYRPDIKCRPHIKNMVNYCSLVKHLQSGLSMPVWPTQLVLLFFFLHHHVFFSLISYVLFLAVTTAPCLPGQWTGHFKSLSDLTLDKELN